MPAEPALRITGWVWVFHSMPDARQGGRYKRREAAGCKGSAWYAAWAGSWSEASALRARFGRTASGHRGVSKSGTRQRGNEGAPASRARVGGKTAGRSVCRVSGVVGLGARTKLVTAISVFAWTTRIHRTFSLNVSHA